MVQSPDRDKDMALFHSNGDTRTQSGASRKGAGGGRIGNAYAAARTCCIRAALVWQLTQDSGDFSVANSVVMASPNPSDFRSVGVGSATTRGRDNRLHHYA